MSKNHLRAKLQDLEARENLLIAQYKAVSQKILSTLDPGDKVKLEAQRTDLDQELEENDRLRKELNAKLDGATTAAGGARNSSWQQYLPEINYKRAREVAGGAFGRLKGSQGGVLFFLQRSTQMGGRWCLEAIRADFLQPEIKSGKLMSHPVGFASWERPNEVEFLVKLAGRLNAQIDANDLTASSQVVIEKLCGAVQIGGTLIVEVNFARSESLQAGLLRWLVEEFWCSLVERLTRLAPEKVDFKVVLTIVAQGAVSPACLKAHLGTLDATFDFKKILELPLEPWTQEEIRWWLARFSGLELAGPELQELAETIYLNSGEGTPASVHLALMEELSRV